MLKWLHNKLTSRTITRRLASYRTTVTPPQPQQLALKRPLKPLQASFSFLHTL